jgi:hypothetical protein
VISLLRDPSFSPPLSLRDIAITARYVNRSPLLLQTADVLETQLRQEGFTGPKGSNAVHLFRTKVCGRSDDMAYGPCTRSVA